MPSGPFKQAREAGDRLRGWSKQTGIVLARSDTPGAPFLGPEGACLRSLIAQRPLPLPFEKVATKFVPFSCPWEVMSREF